MSNCRIPLVSNIIPGLMSQEDKIKLDNWPNSPLEINNLSASNGEFAQFSSSYFSMSSGSVNDLLISRKLLVFGPTNITATAVVPDPLSSSIQRTHEFSSSYFSMSSGSINDLLVSRNFVIQGHSNITSTIPDPLSSSVQRAHQLSASYFSMSSGSVNDLVISRNLVVQGPTNITATAAIPDPLSSSVQRAHQLSASYFSMSSGSINNLVISRNLIIQGHSNITSTIPDPLSSSVQRAHQLSASYFSMSSGSINRLRISDYIDVVNHISSNEIISNYISTTNFETKGDIICGQNLIINGHSNITSTIPDPLSSSVQRANQFSSSYFSMSSGSINNVSINRLQLSGVANISPVSCKILFQNYSCTASTTEFIPLLSQSISPGESWNFYYILPCVLTGTGGIRFTVFSPTGSLIEGFVDGRTTVAASTARSRISSINTEVASTFNNATLIVMPHYIYFTIRNGNNSGNVTLGIRRITATDFCNVLSGSSMMATKIT